MLKVHINRQQNVRRFTTILNDHRTFSGSAFGFPDILVEFATGELGARYVVA